MTDLQALAFAVGILAFTLPGALVFLAVRVQGMLGVTVTQPPITVNQPPIEVNQAPITVQAPTALIPEHVTDILRRIEEKLQPSQVPLDEEKLGQLVTEAVATAERAVKLEGYQKFKAAREVILKRLAELNMTPPDDRALALRIEGAVNALPKP